jgi:hypothetical protein
MWRRLSESRRPETSRLGDPSRFAACEDARPPPDSAFRIPTSGFWFLVSGFHIEPGPPSRFSIVQARV